MKRRYKTLAGLLAKPERWTRFTYWRDSDGNKVAVEDMDVVRQKAVCCCLWGGGLLVRHSLGDESLPVYSILARAFEIEFPKEKNSIVNWQDAPRRKHADILRVARRFDKLVKARTAK